MTTFPDKIKFIGKVRTSTYYFEGHNSTHNICQADMKVEAGGGRWLA
jgi:hypothetical protein